MPAWGNLQENQYGQDMESNERWLKVNKNGTPSGDFTATTHIVNTNNGSAARALKVEGHVQIEGPTSNDNAVIYVKNAEIFVSPTSVSINLGATHIIATSDGDISINGADLTIGPDVQFQGNIQTTGISTLEGDVNIGTAAETGARLIIRKEQLSLDPAVIIYGDTKVDGMLKIHEIIQTIDGGDIIQRVNNSVVIAEVGIPTTVIDEFNVGGNFSVEGNANVDGTLNVDSDATVRNVLTTGDESSIANDLLVGGILKVSQIQTTQGQTEVKVNSPLKAGSGLNVVDQTTMEAAAGTDHVLKVTNTSAVTNTIGIHSSAAIAVDAQGAVRLNKKELILDSENSLTSGTGMVKNPTGHGSGTSIDFYIDGVLRGYLDQSGWRT